MRDIAEADCTSKNMTSEIEKLTEELVQLKQELDKACEEYKKHHAEHCEIKDLMLQQESERQKAFDYFFEQQSIVMKLEQQIKQFTQEKEDLTV